MAIAKKTKKYLAVDIGASNGRAVAGIYDGKTLTTNIIYRFGNGPVTTSGTAYWDILFLFSQIKESLNKANSAYKGLESFSIDSWAADFGLLDSSGKLISNPVSYRDITKSYDLRKEFFENYQLEKFFSVTGYNPLFTFVALFYLYYMQRAGNPVLKIAKKFLMVPDLLNYYFTDVICSEYSINSNTMMLNWKTKDWEPEIIKTIGIDQKIFPEIILSGKKIGNLSKSVADDIGIKRIKVIACASHDTASSTIGIPALKNNWAFIGMGTWCIVGAESEQPVIDRNLLNYRFTNEGSVEGRNFIAKNITGFWILQKCRERWSKNSPKFIDWDLILSGALKEKPFASFIDVDDLQFSQNHVDMPELIINYCRKTNQDIPGTIGQIARCFYESLVLKFKNDLKILENICSTNVEIIHLIGGGIRNEPICQWVADSTGKKVIAGPVETSSAGNLIMQMIADNEIKSIEEGRDIIRLSSKINYYEPQDIEVWEHANARYLDVLENKDCKLRQECF